MGENLSTLGKAPNCLHSLNSTPLRGIEPMTSLGLSLNESSSWAAVLEKRSGLSFPADLYLEGTDQHRGWLQSSLLTTITTKGKAPYFGVITNGFVLDERFLKMSKSLGNVVDPIIMIGGGKNPGEAPSYGIATCKSI
ncbi:hypothetical protein ACSBR2_010577 [Camellia fascicularis]